jgi:GT2 family glycosyltransferase
MSLQLSVIIPSHKRHEPLALCLEDLARQTGVGPDDFEVILVLQAYPPGAADEIRTKFDCRLHLEVAEFESGLGTSRARNAGIAMAKGEIVAFLDDDVRLPNRWVAELIAFYDDPSLGGVGGFVDHPGHYNIARNTMYRLLGLTSNRYKIDWGGFNVGPASHPSADQRAEWLSGGNMSFRRKVIEAVGGFDEALGSFWHEDVDVTHRVAKSGWKVISSRKLAIDHYPSTINRPPLRDQMRERERSRVLFVWKAIGDEPLWRTRYAARLVLHALAMSVVGLAKGDPRIPLNVLRGGWEGYRGLHDSRAASARRMEATR